MVSITLHLNPKTHVITLLRGGHGKDTILELDSSNNAELTEEIFEAKDVTAIDIYEHEIAEVLSEKQQAILYVSWGKALSIMISKTANVLSIDKKLVKEIITQGERHGILYQGNNNTWKISDPTIIRSRWLNRAKDIQNKSKPEKDMTTEGILSRYAEQAKKLGVKGFENHAKGEEGMIVRHSIKKDMIVNKEREKSSTFELPVEIVSEESLIKMKKPISRIEMMKTRLKELELIVIKTDRNDIHERIQERNSLRVNIQNAEMQQPSKYQWSRDTNRNITASGSVTRIEPVGQAHMGDNVSAKIQEPNKGSIPLKQVFTKGKPFKSKK